MIMRVLENIFDFAKGVGDLTFFIINIARDAYLDVTGQPPKADWNPFR